MCNLWCYISLSCKFCRCYENFLSATKFRIQVGIFEKPAIPYFFWRSLKLLTFLDSNVSKSYFLWLKKIENSKVIKRNIITVSFVKTNNKRFSTLLKQIILKSNCEKFGFDKMRLIKGQYFSNRGHFAH